MVNAVVLVKYVQAQASSAVIPPSSAMASAVPAVSLAPMVYAAQLVLLAAARPAATLPRYAV